MKRDNPIFGLAPWISCCAFATKKKISTSKGKISPQKVPTLPCICQTRKPSLFYIERAKRPEYNIDSTITNLGPNENPNSQLKYDRTLRHRFPLSQFFRTACNPTEHEAKTLGKAWTTRYCCPEVVVDVTGSVSTSTVCSGDYVYTKEDLIGDEDDHALYENHFDTSNDATSLVSDVTCISDFRDSYFDFKKQCWISEITLASTDQDSGKDKKTHSFKKRVKSIAVSIFRRMCPCINKMRNVVDHEDLDSDDNVNNDKLNDEIIDERSNDSSDEVEGDINYNVPFIAVPDEVYDNTTVHTFKGDEKSMYPGIHPGITRLRQRHPHY